MLTPIQSLVARRLATIAVEVLHHAAESFITKLFEPACLPAALASRVAVSIPDYGVIKL